MPFYDVTRMTRNRVREVAQESLFVLPIAATAQHGPHLPIGTDVLITQFLAESACRAAGESISVVLGSILPFGNSHYHLEHGAAMSLSVHTLQMVLLDLLFSIHQSGFQRVFILNGHGGNDECIQLAVREGVRLYKFTAGATSYWNVSRPAMEKHHLTPTSGCFPGHAGDFETSMLLHINASFVEGRPDKRATVSVPNNLYHVFYQAPHLQIGQDGYTDDAAQASAVYGREACEVITDEIAKALVAFMTWSG